MAKKEKDKQTNNYLLIEHYTQHRKLSNELHQGALK